MLLPQEFWALAGDADGASAAGNARERIADKRIAADVAATRREGTGSQHGGGDIWGHPASGE